ncbi:MAG: hypothetical protein AAGB19_07420 [Cyanobacteria bacterium P01_F01_bin.3]
MDVSLLRKLWAIVESAPSHRVSTLDDSGVLQWLMELLKADPTFDSQKLPMASTYIQSRLPLIRDLAQQM